MGVNLQMISFRSTFQPNALSTAPCVFARQEGIIIITSHLYPVMVNRMGKVYPNRLYKGSSSRFCVGSLVRHETPEEGWRTYRPKHCESNDEDEVNSLNILSNNKTKEGEHPLSMLISWVLLVVVEFHI